MIYKSNTEKYLDEVRQKVTKSPLWHLFVTILFTVIHDAAGLFSASRVLTGSQTFVEQWNNIVFMVVVFSILIAIDLSSEIMIIWYHDIPLCKKQTLNIRAIQFALAGQILTALIWLALFLLVLVETIILPCSRDASQSWSECKEVHSGVSSVIIVLIVFFKNSKTLFLYRKRAYVYPILCDVSLLWVYHFERDDPQAIIDDFEKFNNLDENPKPRGTAKPIFSGIIYFATLILLDIAAVASVSTLIIVGNNDGAGRTFVRAIPFVIIILLDIFSEILILYFHDIPLCKQKEKKIQKNAFIFRIARVIQVLCSLGWIAAFIYMIYAAVNTNCQDICQCDTVNPANTITGVCTHSGAVLQPSGSTANLANCRVISTTQTCHGAHPSAINCVLLGLIIIEGLFQLSSMFFKSYIYPITLPESIMFLMYWTEGDTDRLVEKIGQNEFGSSWTFRKEQKKGKWQITTGKKEKDRKEKSRLKQLEKESKRAMKGKKPKKGKKKDMDLEKQSPENVKQDPSKNSEIHEDAEQKPTEQV